MRRIAFSLSLLLFTIVFPVAAQKKRVAVLDFDYGTVKSSVAQIFGSDQDVGKGVADILVDRLVNGGVYAVIERKELNRIIAEQNFSNSDRADASTAAKLARILGVDAMIIGSITQFGNDNSTTKAGAGALGSVTGRFGLGGAQKSKSTAVVQITVRVIDTNTAEILASCQGKGEASRGGVGLLGSGGSVYGPSAGAGVDMKSSGFQSTILGEATNKAVTEAATQLEAKAASLPTVTPEINGIVADASDPKAIIINIGSKNGVKVGVVLKVKRKVREVRDPVTDKVIRSVEEAVGTITITEVDADSAVGAFSGAGTPQIKDIVTTK
jgi:curli biogenesis system outer membrane secretion channel CsgG